MSTAIPCISRCIPLCPVCCYPVSVGASPQALPAELYSHSVGHPRVPQRHPPEVPGPIGPPGGRGSLRVPSPPLGLPGRLLCPSPPSRSRSIWAGVITDPNGKHYENRALWRKSQGMEYSLEKLTNMFQTDAPARDPCQISAPCQISQAPLPELYGRHQVHLALAQLGPGGRDPRA